MRVTFFAQFLLASSLVSAAAFAQRPCENPCPDHDCMSFADYPADYNFGGAGTEDDPRGHDGWPGDTPADGPDGNGWPDEFGRMPPPVATLRERRVSTHGYKLLSPLPWDGS